MRFMTYNYDERLQPVILQCRSCEAVWEPYGRAGLNTCSECGNTWAERGFKRIKYGDKK